MPFGSICGRVVADPEIPLPWISCGTIWFGFDSCAVFGTGSPSDGQENIGSGLPIWKKKLVVWVPFAEIVCASIAVCRIWL